jgi:pyruvate dehydrogenase E1 component alpha subunit
MDPEAVHESMKRTADRARNGGGPSFVELKTYRYRGHSMSDPAKYRTKDEVAEYKKVDPVEVIRAKILKLKYLNAKELEAMDNEIEAEVEASVEFAEKSPFPPAEELYEDVYSEEYPFIVE